MRTIKIDDKPLEYFVDKLNRHEKFRFLRFGDGEWLCILGKPKIIGRNEHEVLPELTEDLRFIVQNLKGDHICGLQGLSMRRPDLAKLIPEHNWVNSDVFHHASIAGELCPFIEALKNRNICFVGQENLMKMREYLPKAKFIQVRNKNCYWDKEKTLRKIEQTDADVFLLCASRLSVPLAYHSKKDATFIDCGSLFDVFTGFPLRGYQDRMENGIIKKNLCQ